ncbi:hypothetical protein ASG78_04305 [Nostocoides sp. Soil756]|nr:hypothetical protein ASG78_04305 [Tetrasphaera sp. Soil756]
MQRRGASLRMGAPEKEIMARSTSARTTRPQWAFHLATLCGAGFMVALTVPRTYFVNDDWSFVGPLANGQVGWLWFLLPQNEHLVLLPKLLFAALGSLWGFASSVPFVAVTVSLHLILCHLLWRLALLNGASATVSALGVAGFAVYGAGVENILWAFQVGLVGSMVLGVLLLLEISRDRPRAVVVIALAVANVLTTGLALVFLALATVILLATRRSRWVLALVPAGVVLLVWFLLVSPRSSASQLTVDDAVLLPLYWILGIGTAVSAPLPILRAGEVLDLGMSLQSLGLALAGCVALLAVLLMAERRKVLERALSAKAFALGCPMFVVVTSVPRIASGLPIALSSRYAYVATALLVPLFVVLLSRVGATRSRRVVVLVGSALIAIGNLVQWVPMAHEWNSRAQARLVTMAVGRDLVIGRLPGYDSTPPAPEFAMLSGQELLALSFPSDLPRSRPSTSASTSPARTSRSTTATDEGPSARLTPDEPVGRRVRPTGSVVCGAPPVPPAPGVPTSRRTWCSDAAGGLPSDLTRRRGEGNSRGCREDRSCPCPGSVASRGVDATPRPSVPRAARCAHAARAHPSAGGVAGPPLVGAATRGAPHPRCVPGAAAGRGLLVRAPRRRLAARPAQLGR